SKTNAIKQAKDAILQIIECLLNENVLSENDITCFFYESTYKELRFSDLPEMSLANGTSFVNVFNSIVNNLNRINNNLAIIFFTDGNDNSLNECNKNYLKEALSKVPYRTEVHSIGFTKDYNAHPKYARHNIAVAEIKKMNSSCQNWRSKITTNFVQKKIIELMNEILQYKNNQSHAKCQQFLANIDLLSQQLNSISNHRYNIEDTKFLINMFKNILTKLHYVYFCAYAQTLLKPH
ncbi:5850_t:CDS:2, partial [Gigaspora margarita]